MKKYLFIMMSAMLIASSAGCSSDDDDYSYVQEFSNNNDKENLIGTWHILHYYNGWKTQNSWNRVRCGTIKQMKQ